MGTKLGKVLVLANVFISVGLLAWAVSLYTNRPTYFDGKDGETAVPGQFTRYTAEIKRLTEGAQIAQATYVRSMDGLVTVEQDRAYRISFNNQLLEEARRPRAKDGVPPLFRDIPRHNESELRGLVNYRAPKPFPPAKDLRNRDLVGFGVLQETMRALQKDEKDKGDQIRTLRTEVNDRSLEIFNPATKGGVQAEVFKMKAIFQNLEDERTQLDDAQTNWDEQLRTLKVRKQQLEARIAEFGKPAAADTGKGD